MCVRQLKHIYIYIYIYKKLVPPNVQDMVTALQPRIYFRFINVKVNIKWRRVQVRSD